MIERLKLVNWKSHTNSEYVFSKGTNILVGQMGAGKTSILQAISYVLFGTFYEMKSREIKTLDVLNRNSNVSFAEVEMTASDFSVRRKITERGVEAVLRDPSGKLIAGNNPAQVNDYVAQALKIDDDIFLRTVYARQNDIDLFLKVSPGERKKKLDEIMGLDKFETVRKNAISLLNSIGKKMRDRESYIHSISVENLDMQINGLNDEIENLRHAEKELLQNLLAAKALKIEVERILKSLRKAHEEYTKLEAERDFKSKQIQELEQKLAGAQAGEPERLNERLAEAKLKISELQKTRQAISDDLRKQGRQSLEIERELGGLEARYADIGRRISEAESMTQKINIVVAEWGSTALLDGRLNEVAGKLRASGNEQQQYNVEINILEKNLKELEGFTN
ncbi:MAG: SMC family ATPase [DPANN group archaeon]|nr:SMC family ATPase [DPANN group archaeon]